MKASQSMIKSKNRVRIFVSFTASLTLYLALSGCVMIHTEGQFYPTWSWSAAAKHQRQVLAWERQAREPQPQPTTDH